MKKKKKKQIKYISGPPGPPGPMGPNGADGKDGVSVDPVALHCIMEDIKRNRRDLAALEETLSALLEHLNLAPWTQPAKTVMVKRRKFRKWGIFS